MCVSGRRFESRRAIFVYCFRVPFLFTFVTVWRCDRVCFHNRLGLGPDLLYLTPWYVFICIQSAASASAALCVAVAAAAAAAAASAALCVAKLLLSLLLLLLLLAAAVRHRVRDGKFCGWFIH